MMKIEIKPSLTKDENARWVVECRTLTHFLGANYKMANI